MADDNFLSFLFGMKKEEAKKRYDLKLTKTDATITSTWKSRRETPPTRWTSSRRKSFCSRTRMLPRRLWFEQPNSAETTWDVLQINTNDRTIDRREFDAPTPPPGWKLVNAAKDAESPPRVARPSGGN